MKAIENDVTCWSAGDFNYGFIACIWLTTGLFSHPHDVTSRYQTESQVVV